MWAAGIEKDIKMMSMMSTSSLGLLVEKATNDQLTQPDWAMNVEICDHINSHPWHGKDFVKAVKKRLQHKNPKIQFLALTLLETMVKNCGDLIHFKVAEKNIPKEMVKMVKKRAEINVHDKILLLLDAWQEAFGGPRGKHPQYYHAYNEIRRSGIPFPKRSADAAPILTPPLAQPTSQVGNGLERLENAITTEIEGLSISTIGSTKNVMELLDDMLRAVNPKDCEAINDEIIVDLVNQCRANQQKLMQMLTTTNDEEILTQGLKLNDNMQNVLAKHDSIAFGIPLSSPLKRLSSHHRPNKQQVITGPKDKEAVVYPSYDEEKEDDAQRQSKGGQPNLELISTSSGESSSISPTPSSPSTSTRCSCKTLALSNPPPPTNTKSTQEQDLIDLLSLTITTPPPPPSPQTPSPNQNTPHQPPDPFTSPHGPVSAPFDSYITPWAQPNNSQPLMTQQFQSPNFQPQYLQPMPPPHSASYYNNNNNYYPSSPMSKPEQSFGNWAGTNSSYQYYSASSPARANNNGMAKVTSSTINITQQMGHKSFIPSYRLFEELNVMGSAEAGRVKVSNGVSPGLTGNSGQNMVGGSGR